MLAGTLALGRHGAAAAHTGERAIVLLLPTERYMAAGALVVALSFVALAFAPRAGPRALASLRWRLGAGPRRDPVAPSLVVLALVLALAIAGYVGSRDPLANPLPAMVWTVWWVGLTFLHALFGDLWAWLNPWRGAYRLLALLPGPRAWRARPPLGYPPWLGYWPACGWFLAFAWFELIDPAPQDPARLAGAVAAYLGATLVGMVLFGEAAWLERGEPFAVFFRLVSRLSPLEPRREAGRIVYRAAIPGARLLSVGAMPASGVAFVLLVLASVSFDGLSRTFWWLALLGENPLEYPGRTALMAANTLGLVGLCGVFLAAFATAVRLGRALGGARRAAADTLGRFVVSLVPIAFGYHFAHYLPVFLVDVQYALRALSDPFALGWDLLGTRDLHVTVSFLADHGWVRAIWNLQAIGIVAAHVVALAVAHVLALGEAADPRRAVRGQLPMTALMIGYTVFGLWLLATPAIG